MVTAETQLVTFTHGPASAHVNAEAEANAVAQFNLRRGLRLSLDARAKIEGDLQEKLSTDPDFASAAATVSASIGAAARVALAAQLDVNGLWAEFCAAAEARAQIRGDIAVTGQLLLDALDADELLPAGALVPAIALLKEVEVRAGVYAEAYFALRARARLMVGGSVIPREDEDREAGFTVAFDYGYAYIWGAGISGYLDVDLPDASRVVTVVADAVIDEVVRLLPAGTPKLVESLLRMVVPLAASAAVAVGKALGAPQPVDPGAGPAGGSSVTDALLAELSTHGLTLALNAVLDAGMAAVSDLVNRSLDSVGLTDAVRTAGKAALDDVKSILDALDRAESLPDALPHIAGLCDRLGTFAAGAAPEVEGFTDVAVGLTVAAAASGILQQVLGRDPMPGFPDASAQRISKTGTLTVADLVTYVAGNIGKLGESPLSSVGWLADLAGCAAPDLISLLWTLGEANPDPAARTQLATDLVHGITSQLTDHLRPFLDRQELPPDLKDVAAFIEPLLDVVEQALVPALAATDKREAAQVRDELDTLLTGMFGAIVVRCMNAVIRPFFSRAEVQLTELADHVDGLADHLARADPEFADFFKVANEADVVFRISPAIVSASLREIAGVLDLAEHSAFDSAVKMMRSFVLLPADSAERRAQLARLADGSEARITEGQLRSDLLEAVFVDSTEFALGMVGPSIRMSTVIAADQGPLPLVTLYTDAVQVGTSTAAAIADLGGVTTTVGEVIASLGDGKVTARELLELGKSLKRLIGDTDVLVKDVIALIKLFTWPAFLTATGGLGAIPSWRKKFDEFFDGADWLVDEAKERLDQLTDALIEAMIAVAQDVGVLDTGSGDDLGTLGQAVRQRTLGAPGQAGVDLLDGKVHLSHAEMATMATNAAFANSKVRDTIRTFHDHAVTQANTAREAVTLLMLDLTEARAAQKVLEARLAAQQRDTGFVFGIKIERIERESATGPLTRFQVAITGAGREFVDGDHPLVRVEVGGWPVPIAGAAWRVEADGTLRGWFVILGDPSLLAPHPFVSEGVVAMSPQQGKHGVGISPLLDAVYGIAGQRASRSMAVEDPARFLTSPITRDQPPVALTEEMFVPPVLRNAGAAGGRFPGVLALDRQALIAATTDTSTVDTLTQLPGTRHLAFVSSADTATVGLLTKLAEGSSSSTGSNNGHPLTILARARPGYTTITAAVHAVPKPGQDHTSTLGKDAEPTWFVLAGVPVSSNSAEFVTEMGTIPAGLPHGASATIMVVMRNTGTATWTSAAGYKLGLAHPLGGRFQELPHDVLPDENVSFAITVNSPPAEGMTFSWQMVQDHAADQEWFGETSPVHMIALLVNSAARGPQVGVPTSIPRGSTVAVSVTMKNNGTTTWTQDTGYRLGATGYPFGSPRHELTKQVKPGDSFAFTFTIAAPPSPSAFEWQMTQYNDGWFGQRSLLVTIAPAEPTACAGLRASIKALKGDIADLQKELKKAAPQDKGGIKQQIAEAEDELKKVQNQATALGCSA
jgi:hypothetical protein